MKRLILAAIRCSLMFLLPAVAHAGSAQWDLNPISGDWNTAANWTPNEVPNGPADIATFGLSNTTDVSISADTEVNSIVFTPAATNPYTIVLGSGLTLTLSGTGITNNSGITQRFVLESAEETQMRFTSSASAGNATINMAGSGLINFFNRSTAGSATIADDNGGGSVQFFNTSTAGNALIDYSNGVFNFVSFSDNSTAGSATLFAGDSGFVIFGNHSSAGNATIFGGPACSIEFAEFSTARNATIQGAGTQMDFIGSSKGGTSAIGLFFNFGLEIPSTLNISGHNAPGVTIGSLGGDETAFVSLGANNLTIGSNNLSTTFSGAIQDGGRGGSLTKIGSGTLILSGANTYTGNTNVNGGVLQVDGSITSNTLVNHGGTLAGAGTINGNVVNNARVSPGALGVPGELTVVHDYTQAQYATLMIQIAGMNPDQFSVLNVLGNASLNGFLDPVLLNGFVPSIGDSFTFLNYTSLTGEFAHINHRVFDNGMLEWSVIYQANNAILTVEQNVPDQGSTFLLLTLGLLGLVTYRRQLLRGRP